MAKFINTTYKDAIGSLKDGLKNKLDNSYYNSVNEHPTKTIYYNQDILKSTLDEGSGLSYAPLGEQSPTRFNKIYDAFLYGMSKILLDLDNGEFGIESNSIEGEAIVIPNTFQPIPEDYFYIVHINKVILFKVTSVNMDTLENGANFYKLTYKLDQYDYKENILDKQVVEEFRMTTNNLGTQFKNVIKSKDYDFITELELTLSRLKTYYENLFFNSKVQTFTYLLDDAHIYDPYLIEFLIRNKILEGSDSYIYVSHQVRTPKTFFLDYDKTFFRNLELCSKDKILTKNAYGILINDPNSLLSTRLENYFRIDYNMNGMLSTPIQTTELELIDRILSNDLFIDNEKLFYNIIIKYFNNERLGINTLDILEDIDFNSNITLFYNIPILIFILEDTIKKLLLK